MPRRLGYDEESARWKRARSGPFTDGMESTVYVPRYIPVMFAEQRLLTPLGIAVPDGSKPTEFQVQPGILVGTKNEIKLRLNMKLDNTDSQHTIAPGDVIRGELV